MLLAFGKIRASILHLIKQSVPLREALGCSQASTNLV